MQLFAPRAAACSPSGRRCDFVHPWDQEAPEVSILVGGHWVVDVSHTDGGVEDAPLVHSIQHKAPDTLVNLHKGALLSASPRSASHPSHFQHSQRSKMFQKGFRLDWPAAGMDKDHLMNTMSNCLAQGVSTALSAPHLCLHTPGVQHQPHSDRNRIQGTFQPQETQGSGT